MSYFFVTSNQKKASDAMRAGFEVRQDVDLPLEIDHDDVMEVAIHKALECKEDDIVVEDTAFDIEGLKIGTHIKHFFDDLEKKHENFIGRAASWTVALALKHESLVIVTQKKLEGRWFYPCKEEAYHFEKYFQIQTVQGWKYLHEISEHELDRIHPRLSALKELSAQLKAWSFLNDKSIKEDDKVQWAKKSLHPDCWVMERKSIQSWTGKYQKEQSLMLDEQENKIQKEVRKKIP